MKYLQLPISETRILPFYLAMEEYAARIIGDDDIFFMWQVSPTVIFGRNQLIENEVNIPYCREHGIPTIVDSRYDIFRFKTVDYIKQNDAELAAAVGRQLETEEELVEAGRELLALMEAKGALITRGEDGMTLFQKDGSVAHIPVTDKSEVYDVSGAGDTCVATVILGLAAGVEPVLASRLSNEASGIAVRKMGTAVVSADELRSKFR